MRKISHEINWVFSVMLHNMFLTWTAIFIIAFPHATVESLLFSSIKSPLGNIGGFPSFYKFQKRNTELYSSEMTSELVPGGLYFPENMSNEWELDCYSRPVLTADGKKLWEVLITDSVSNFRYIKPVASNIVNSRTLRGIIEEVIEASPVKPKVIRFFRNQMFNMITIALNSIDVEVKPSRATSNLCMWLQEREDEVYPKMPGYNSQLKQQTILDYEVTQAERLPDVLRAESYAFVALPAEVFWDNQVNKDNIERGKLCSIKEMPKTGWIHGITLFSKRAASIAAWMSGLEIGSIKAELLSRELLLNTDITTQFIIAPLLDAQKKEAQIFEKGKSEALGYHFISVQSSPESEGVEGFWLLRTFGNNL